MLPAKGASGPGTKTSPWGSIGCVPRDRFGGRLVSKAPNLLESAVLGGGGTYHSPFFLHLLHLSGTLL